jgi:choline dehydrogenase-like flavoprotein
MNVTHIRSLDDGVTEFFADVCIIGAGAGGIYLASRLAKFGISVVMLEAGDYACSDSLSLGLNATMMREEYRSATSGRAFGLGGTTALWGGQLVAYTAIDVQQQETGFDAWAHIVDVTTTYSGRVKQALGIDNGNPSDVIVDAAIGDTKSSLHDCGLSIMASEFLPFRRKNFRFLLAQLPRQTKLTLFLGATASSYAFIKAKDNVNQLTSVFARSGQKELKVSARFFVLAAGSIESTRILLEMNSRNGYAVTPKNAKIGSYLSDHLSLPIAQVNSASLALAKSLFAPRFDHGRMRSFRFFERPGPGRRSRGFAHFIFENDNSGFEVAKKVLAGMQSRVFPDVSIAELVHGASGILGLAWDRFVRSRLYIANGTASHLQLDVEQLPDINNKISLGTALDSHGRPVAEISWEITAADYENIETSARRILSMWANSDTRLPILDAISDICIGQKPHDAYHPVGTCRLGVDRESVVSPDIKVHGTANVFLLSTAVFPSAGSANPTFSMLCFAERLSDLLCSEVKADG